MEEVYVGSPMFMSPELFENWATNRVHRWIKYNPFAADVYSLGIIVLRLMGIEKAEICSFKDK